MPRFATFAASAMFGFCALCSAASAEVTPSVSPTDDRVRTVVFTERQVYRIDTKVLTATTIEFGPGEEIINVALGDNVGFTYGQLGDNSLAVKPTQTGVRTNMSVATSRGTYVFEMIEGARRPMYLVEFAYPKSGAATRRATVTANPSNTVGQGTIIEAALEVAINSDLQGQVAAIVSRDVWSMDMTRVLVPRGSKLFGTYNSEMGQTQKRVLVAWTRLTTTDGQSISLKSYGSDRLGRSGMVSEVNNHFASRFGSAALVSVISALPLLLSNDGDDSSGASNDAAANVSASLSGAVGDVMKGYLGQKPTILVHQGSNVSIRVDSDLEFY